jgi:far upstream element-binding protein
MLPLPSPAAALPLQFGAGVTRVVTCDKQVVGRIIGKGGETIKGLQRNHACSVQIDQTGVPIRVTINGPAAQVALCERAIVDLIEDRAHLGGMSAAGGFGAGSFGAAYGAAAAAPAYGGYGAAAAAPAYGAYPSAAGGYGGYPPAPAQAGYGAGGYGAAGGYSQGGPPPGPPPMTKPLWQEMKDDQNRSYFYNTQTGVSQWERPANM